VVFTIKFINIEIAADFSIENINSTGCFLNYKSPSKLERLFFRTKNFFIF